MLGRILISCLAALAILSLASVRAAVVPSNQSHGFGQCGLAPYDITGEIIKKNGLDASNADEVDKFWRDHVPAAYRYEWRHYFRPVALRQARLEPIKEPILIRLKVLYDETLAAQHPNVDTLRRFIRNVLLDVQMVLWQPELFNNVKIQLMVVELAQLDKKLEVKDTMESILKKIDKYNPRADNSIDYYDMVLVFVYRVLYDLRPDSSIQPAVGVSSSYTFCNQKINPLGSRGVLVQVFSGTVTIAAHEIGHALGLMHDGSEPNVFAGTAACNSKDYIMATFSDIGQTRWSECSVQAMLIYLRRPEVFACALDQNRTGDAKPLSPLFDWRDPNKISVLPGQEMPPEEQCLLVLGEPAQPKKEASDKNNAPWDDKFLDSCQALYCEIHGRNIYVGPSLDGSTCLTHPEKVAGRCINRGCIIGELKKPANSGVTP